MGELGLRDRPHVLGVQVEGADGEAEAGVVQGVQGCGQVVVTAAVAGRVVPAPLGEQLVHPGVVGSWVHRAGGARVLPGRMTHRHDGELVVFLIGMRVNRWYRPDLWLPVSGAESMYVDMPVRGLAAATTSVSVARARDRSGAEPAEAPARG